MEAVRSRGLPLILLGGAFLGSLAPLVAPGEAPGLELVGFALGWPAWLVASATDPGDDLWLYLVVDVVVYALLFTATLLVSPPRARVLASAWLATAAGSLVWIVANMVDAVVGRV